MARLITTWRSPLNPLDWGFYVSENEQEATEVMTNIMAQGVTHFNTHVLGEKVPGLSSEVKPQ